MDDTAQHRQVVRMVTVMSDGGEHYEVLPLPSPGEEEVDNTAAFYPGWLFVFCLYPFWTVCAVALLETLKSWSVVSTYVITPRFVW